MQARMNNVANLFPEAVKGLYQVNLAAQSAGVPNITLELMQLRVSQINGCSVCVDQHPKLLRKAGETDERIFAVAAWEDAPYFTEAERAALALAEAVTRLSDRANPVPDDVWAKAAEHYDEKQLGALLLSIATINVWNRLNVATKQPAGQAW